MGILRRIAGFLGLTREEEEEEHAEARHPNGGGVDGGGRTGAGPPRAAGRGFGGVQVPVAVERPSPGPVLVPCDPGEGGIQVLLLCPPFALSSDPVAKLMGKVESFICVCYCFFLPSFVIPICICFMCINVKAIFHESYKHLELDRTRILILLQEKDELYGFLFGQKVSDEGGIRT